MKPQQMPEQIGWIEVALFMLIFVAFLLMMWLKPHALIKERNALWHRMWPQFKWSEVASFIQIYGITIKELDELYYSALHTEQERAILKQIIEHLTEFPVAKSEIVFIQQPQGKEVKLGVWIDAPHIVLTSPEGSSKSSGVNDSGIELDSFNRQNGFNNHPRTNGYKPKKPD